MNKTTILFSLITHQVQRIKTRHRIHTSMDPNSQQGCFPCKIAMFCILIYRSKFSDVSSRKLHCIAMYYNRIITLMKCMQKRNAATIDQNYVFEKWSCYRNVQYIFGNQDMQYMFEKSHIKDKEQHTKQYSFHLNYELAICLYAESGITLKLNKARPGCLHAENAKFYSVSFLKE